MELIKNIQNSAFIIKNVFTKELLDELLNELTYKINKNHFLVRMTYWNDNNEYIDIKKRYIDCDNDILKIFNNSEKINGIQKLSELKVSDILNKKLLPYYKKALKLVYEEYDEAEFINDENDLFKYSPGNFMEVHCDNGNTRRLCTTMLYLNDMEDDFKGGEVVFYQEENSNSEIIFKYRPNKGDLIILDSSEKYNKKGIPHAVTKIENWNRYVNRIYWKNIPI